jgi:hypothetical protein
MVRIGTIAKVLHGGFDLTYPNRNAIFGPPNAVPIFLSEEEGEQIERNYPAGIQKKGRGGKDLTLIAPNDLDASVFQHIREPVNRYLNPSSGKVLEAGAENLAALIEEEVSGACDGHQRNIQSSLPHQDLEVFRSRCLRGKKQDQ